MHLICLEINTIQTKDAKQVMIISTGYKIRLMFCLSSDGPKGFRGTSSPPVWRYLDSNSVILELYDAMKMNMKIWRR